MARFSSGGRLVSKDKVEERLRDLRYRKVSGSRWIKDGRTARVLHSSEYGNYIRVIWKEKWKDDHVIVFDYSEAKGPVCIVPVSELFESDFVADKRRQASYANSGYWWSQVLPSDHELASLVLRFRDRWDLL